MSAAVEPPSARAASRAAWASPWRWVYLAAVTAGAFVRLEGIDHQIVADDEWHQLHALRDHDWRWISTHLGFADHCIPLTLLSEGLANTVGLSEIVLRAPALLAGIAAVVLLPLFVREWVGAKPAALFAWLVAFAPMHVHFSRYARPYALVFLLSGLAACAYERWMRDRRARWAALGAASSVLGTWALPIAAPFLLGPFAFFALRSLRRAGPAAALGRGGDLRALAAPGALVALALAALLGPPLWTDFQSVSDRAGKEGIQATSFRGLYELLSGTGRAELQFAFYLAALLGAVALFDRRRDLLAYLGFLAGAQVALIALLRPYAVGVPFVLARYLLPFLPVLLLAVALGLEDLDRRLGARWRRAPPHALSLACCAALLALGPLPGLLLTRRPNDWTNHAVYQTHYSERDRMEWLRLTLWPHRMPPFYIQARALEPEAPLVEAPWNFSWSFNLLPVYQWMHRHPTLVGFLGEPSEPPGPAELSWGDPRFRFRSFVHVGDFAELRARGVRFVVFHRNLFAEFREADGPRSPDIEPWAARYRDRFGAPFYEDEALVVFDVKAAPGAEGPRD